MLIVLWNDAECAEEKTTNDKALFFPKAEGPLSPIQSVVISFSQLGPYRLLPDQNWPFDLRSLDGLHTVTSLHLDRQASGHKHKRVLRHIEFFDKAETEKENKAS